MGGEGFLLTLPPSGTNKVTVNQFGSRRLDLKELSNQKHALNTFPSPTSLGGNSSVRFRPTGVVEPMAGQEQPNNCSKQQQERQPPIPKLPAYAIHPTIGPLIRHRQ